MKGLRLMLPWIVYKLAWNTLTLYVYKATIFVLRIDTCQANRLLPLTFNILGGLNIILACAMNPDMRNDVGNW